MLKETHLRQVIDLHFQSSSADKERMRTLRQLMPFALILSVLSRAAGNCDFAQFAPNPFSSQRENLKNELIEHSVHRHSPAVTPLRIEAYVKYLEACQTHVSHMENEEIHAKLMAWISGEIEKNGFLPGLEPRGTVVQQIHMSPKNMEELVSWAVVALHKPKADALTDLSNNLYSMAVRNLSYDFYSYAKGENRNFQKELFENAKLLETALMVEELKFRLASFKWTIFSGPKSETEQWAHHYSKMAEYAGKHKEHADSEPFVRWLHPRQVGLEEGKELRALFAD